MSNVINLSEYQIQGDLFAQRPENEGDDCYLNLATDYSLLPIYDAAKLGNSKTPIDYTEVRQRVFRDVGRGESEYTVQIRAGYTETKAGIKHRFPGVREELVELCLLEIASHNPCIDEKGLSVEFNVGWIRKRLCEYGHKVNGLAVKEALDVLSTTHVRIFDEQGSLLGTGNIISNMSATHWRHNTKGSPKGKILFHPMVSESIKGRNYRLVDYHLAMQMSPLGRYLYKYMNNIWTNITPYHIREFKMYRMLENHGRAPLSSFRATKDLFERALDELKSFNIIKEYTSEDKVVNGACSDSVFQVSVTDSFVKHVKRANFFVNRTEEEYDRKVAIFQEALF